MPCFRPLHAFYSKTVNPTGKRSIVFSKREALSTDLDDQLTLSCGQCRYCRLEHSRNWAVRCSHEASLYTLNSFITLTYHDDFLPQNSSLDYEAPVQFMKDLRRKFGDGIRSFGCAEYGEKLSRPHYHLCLFNHDFLDKKPWSKNNENQLYTSKDLQELWPYGHSTVGDLTFESAAYVARYVTKKITGKKAQSHYETIDYSTGEVFEKLPERSVSVSRMPGIGRTWFEKNYQYLLDHDFVISRGKKVRPPKYYDRLLEKFHPESFERVKEKRRLSGDLGYAKVEEEHCQALEKYFTRHDAMEHGVPFPKYRLFVMEEVQELKFQLLIRGLENA